MTDRVKARIDAHSGVLYARRADTRTSTFHSALKAGIPARAALPCTRAC